MSIRPFSSNETQNLMEFIQKNGWKIEGIIENFFRYSLKKNKLVLFTIKVPVTLPLRINVPFEIVSFRVSLAFQLWHLNQYIYKTILYLMKSLRNLAISLSMDHKFPIEGKQQQIIDLLNLILPELISNENENTWLNRIRISLMSKRDQLKVFKPEKLRSLVETLINSGLEPTFKQPWELRKGVPKIRTSETLFFSNEENFDEFFILEKGYYTYFKDISYNKYYIRSAFDSYTPYILNDLFNDIPDFKLELYIENWIKFSRIILNSILKILSQGNINQHEFIQFRPEKELIDNVENFISDQNNFPFSALRYESFIAKEVFPIHTDLLNKPPTNFEVIETMNQYTAAEELIKNYRFEEATNIFNDSLKVFNKNQQKKIVVSILLKLRNIAILLDQRDAALNYLQNALGVAKSGEVPIEYIIKIHYKLGKAHYKRKDFEKSLNHFKIIINFLKSEDVTLIKEEYIGMAYLYIGLINSEQNNIVESKTNFKKVLELSKNSNKIKLKYYLLRAIQLKNKGNLSHAQKLLRVGINEVGFDFSDDNYRNILIDLILELAEFYIHYRKDSKKAFFLLNKIQNHLFFKKVNDIRRSVRWNLLMSDYYNIVARDSKNSQFYLKQSQKLKVQLRTIGIRE
ncbi:MAG: tol-pal system YbgF family protein [Candidatus Hodarchaeota archaeon]